MRVNRLTTHSRRMLQTRRSDIVLLGDDNPARLTRTQYRLCHLLSRGLCYDVVRAEMGINAVTLRAHLREILIKAAMSDLLELRENLRKNPCSARPTGFACKSLPNNGAFRLAQLPDQERMTLARPVAQRCVQKANERPDQGSARLRSSPTG